MTADNLEDQEMPFEPAPVQPDPSTSLSGQSVYIDGELTVEDAGRAFAVVGFHLYNDGTGRLVARQILPSLLKEVAA